MFGQYKLGVLTFEILDEYLIGTIKTMPNFCGGYFLKIVNDRSTPP